MRAPAGPATSVRRTSGRIPLVAVVLAGGTFLMATSEFVAAGLLPELARDFRIDVSEAGLVITVFAVGGIVGAPVVVLLALRLPHRTILAVALLVFAAGHVVAALSTGFAVLLAARLVTAVATGGFWAVASLVASDAAEPGARMRALGVIQAGGTLANVLGVPLGSFAGQVIGWRGPFWGLAALALVAGAVLTRLVPRPAAGPRPTVRRELVALRSVRLWLTLITCVFVTGAVLSVFGYISPILIDRTGLPESAVPLGLVLFGVTALAGALAGGRLGDARPFGTALTSATITLVAIGGLGLLSRSPVPALICVGLLGLSGLSANPVLSSMAIRFGESGPLLASSLLPSAFNLGTAIGTGTASVALDGPLGTLAPIVVGATSATLALLSFAVLRVTDRHRAHVSSTAA